MHNAKIAIGSTRCHTAAVNDPLLVTTILLDTTGARPAGDPSELQVRRAMRDVDRPSPNGGMTPLPSGTRLFICMTLGKR